MKYIILFMLSLIICSCGKDNTTENLPDISQANNIKLYYKEDFDDSGKMKILTREILDMTTINKMKKLIDYEPFSYVYCTSTGSMSFYKDSTLIVSMVFNILPDQQHIAYNYYGKVIAIKLSESNADFIESFKN